jgi:methionine sulfoxide reductase heme-binding subunit
MHLTSSPVDWYAARAAGITAYLLLSGVVLLGLTMAAKKPFARWPRFTVEDVHRFGGLLVGSFVTIHVVTVAVDSWLPFSLQSIVVPFISRYRPIWVGLGIAAAELLVALAVTNHYRRRLPYTFWRRAHYLNFAVWGAATVHGLGSGTDRSAPWALGVYAAAVATVSAAIVWRIARGRLGVWTIPAAGLASAGAVALVVGLGTGPLHFRPRPWNAAHFTEQLTGRITQLSGVSRGIVSMVGQGQGEQNVLVRADLLIAPRKLLKTSFQMEYLPSGELCTGTVTKVHATAFAAVCRLRTGEGRTISASWQASGSADIAGGLITASKF